MMTRRNLPPITRFPLAASIFLLAAWPLMADGEWNPDTTFPALAPPDAIKSIEVPPGYHLNCVASEPMVEEPAMIAFDGAGSLYICEL